ncbi:Golgi to ER traffic protein 4 homolog isoform X2 [Daktulosphaira vitifoliae]|uniref:Golgi to ER traffic protein 4 homolog isoform X2 n=1 Tax=Daktulosphaira vitifoliae TaxID=58002 RepID=UPI0021AA99E0|nr:Golgi to ER traffic protein 4 homolog isoform X2 [Daktulosphaira vitifoliae]
MTSRSDPNYLINRVRRTLDNSLRDENYYMAHQLYKSLYSRYLGVQKKEDAIKTLFEGIIVLLENNQNVSAIDLSQVFAKSLSTHHIIPNDEIFKYVKEIFKKFGRTLSLERESMLSIVLQWTIEFCPEYPHGHPSLHKCIGFIYWSESNYSSAQYHYLRSTDGIGFAAMLVELHKTRGFKHEVDLFIAQVVLQGLCVRNKIIAQTTFQSYTKLHPAINDKPPYILPLLNFICFLLKILDGGKLKTYIVLCEQYEASLTRDPSYTKYLDKIGQLFFNVKPIERRSRQQNGFLTTQFIVKKTVQCGCGIVGTSINDM